jgi:hypothetical protein
MTAPKRAVCPRLFGQRQTIIDAMTVAKVKRAIEAFERTRSSNHSSFGMLLPFIIDHLERAGRGYRLTKFPSGGHHIEEYKP